MKTVVFCLIFIAAGIFCIAARIFIKRKTSSPAMAGDEHRALRRLNLISSRFVLVLGLGSLGAGAAVPFFPHCIDVITLGYIAFLTLLLIALLIFINADSKKRK